MEGIKILRAALRIIVNQFHRAARDFSYPSMI
jgi:hypothetical protein